MAQETGAIPDDVPEVELTHEGELCSFDTFLKKYELIDPALRQLAVIVRAADTDRFDLAPQAAGLFAISLGLSANIPDDHEMLKVGMVVYDALYTWCKNGQGETHKLAAGDAMTRWRVVGEPACFPRTLRRPSPVRLPGSPGTFCSL